MASRPRAPIAAPSCPADTWYREPDLTRQGSLTPDIVVSGTLKGAKFLHLAAIGAAAGGESGLLERTRHQQSPVKMGD